MEIKSKMSHAIKKRNKNTYRSEKILKDFNPINSNPLNKIC